VLINCQGLNVVVMNGLLLVISFRSSSWIVSYGTIRLVNGFDLYYNKIKPINDGTEHKLNSIRFIQQDSE
jgi:hypothetical protein